MTTTAPPPRGVLSALTIIERVGSILSLIGCLFIIVTFLSSSGFRKPINRLVFYASFGNMLVNVGTLIARAYVDKQDSVGCQLQAFLIQQFLPSDALWALAMAFNVYLTFYHKFDAEKLRRMEKWYFLICYGLPLPPALAYIFISTRSRGRIYGDAVLWCWVSTSWDILRIATFYGPIWVVLSATFFIYIRAGREIYKKRSQLRSLDSNSHGGNDIDIYKLTGREPVQGLETAPIPESRAYSVTVSSTRDPPPAMAASVDASTNTANAGARRRRNHDASSAAWAYTKCAMLFFTALLVTWIPSSANRVYTIAHQGENVVALEILSAIVLPLQGFWNAMIYIVTSWGAVKMFFSDISDRMRRGGSSPSNDGGSPATKDPHSLSFNLRSRGHDGEETDSMTELAVNAIPISKLSRDNAAAAL
ncbi:putative G-protein coupled receptor [Rosellinia necatrix]|uniref:Putative G-protein coupled receptor n=1 Tax=Rosellinia necatrix TaxID=77044 RepID=A0A1W2THI3_ROSNE|nr:putative G-protein coupled receptor [Rosellinia necatrix]